ncbi:hypothetical protein H0H81_008120 [Sphagnurus paluster]|uniref:AAA+ ATPase domain-containing protein n=1 Tax=Sphagnurus paluster TaxID=117069 RepID=A0A9P7KJ38_9AGAR|nr:hypothetical protein H0H81_008120 [Sphagnurus paluster]
MLFLEALRLSARPATRTAHSLCARHLSTATKSTLFPSRPYRTPSIFSCTPYPRRKISLGSIFGRSQSLQTPSPLVVAHITRLEAEANVNPHDSSKQLALFQALADTKLKSSYDLIISRWERMCEFTSINSAVRRRDSLLASSSVTPATVQVLDSDSSTVISGTPESPSSSNTIPATESMNSPPLTSSQQIAQAVLQGQGETVASQSGGSQADIKKLQANYDGSSGSPIQVSIVERKGSWIPRTIRFLVLVLVSSFFFLVILSVFFENTGFMKAGPRQSQFEPSEGKTVKFSDVHGVDEAKDELQDVVQFLKDPTAFASLGGRLPTGVLLTGPPGTGKTMLARAVAGEAGVPFFFASGSDFEEMFVGVGAKRVRELFAAARKKEPAIIFIDELDAVGGKRSSRDQQYMKQTLNQLLVEMDGFQQSDGVIVIAATNFPESLDHTRALVRPGRFDRHIAVPLPDVRGRVQILKHHMQGVTTSSDVDPKVLARGTPGFSGADLQNMVNQAAIQASKERATEVTLRHFEWAKDRILMGAERKSQYIDPEAKLATAYHEQWGFSKLGPVFYDDRDENLSTRRKEEIEEEVTRIVRGGEARAVALLTEKLEELHRLAHALVEHETLDSEEVKKVIKGEPIRNITEVLDEELSN